jgi:hypothetical protein
MSTEQQSTEQHEIHYDWLTPESRQRAQERADFRIITVKSMVPPAAEHLKSGTRFDNRAPRVSQVVALWERHEAHPNGEVFIAGDQPVQVARTPRVLEKLITGELLLVEDAEEQATDDSKQS